MRLIFTHSQANPPIHQWIRQSKNLLQRNEKAKTIGNRIQVASRQIRQHLDCDSDWVIYLCSCKKCGGQYVGKSKTPFKTRHSNHKQEINKKIGGLGHHYGGSGGCGYANFSVPIIDQVKLKTMDFLAKKETFWQHQLRVYVENSCYGHCYRTDI